MLDQVFDEISQALLYEGYVIFERDRSAANNHALAVGTVVPKLSDIPEAWQMQTECLVIGTENTAIDLRLRFFCLQGDDAVEERMNVSRSILKALTGEAKRLEFALFPEREILATVAIAASKLADGLFKITVQVQNLSTPTIAQQTNYDEMLRHSMFAMHAFLHLEAGDFVSSQNPPEEFRSASLQCRNHRTRPILYGKNGERKTMLSSSFVRRDYPEIVVENAGQPMPRLHPDWRILPE